MSLAVPEAGSPGSHLCPVSSIHCLLHTPRGCLKHVGTFSGPKHMPALDPQPAACFPISANGSSVLPAVQAPNLGVAFGPSLCATAHVRSIGKPCRPCLQNRPRPGRPLPLPPARSKHHHPFSAELPLLLHRSPSISLTTPPRPHCSLTLNTEAAWLVENLSWIKPVFHPKLLVSSHFTRSLRCPQP